MTYVNKATTPTQVWKRARGYYTTGRVYIAKTRHGWAYGVVDGDELVEYGQTTRPMGRAKVLAERLVAS